MTNVASVLKNEISRVARKELRSETASLKKAVSHYRSEIAALKRRLQTLEQTLRTLGKTSPRAKAAAAEETEEPSRKLRFSAKGLATQRRRLGLSAHDCGLLVGTSGQSIYNWESGKAKPRGKQLPAIAALKAMGKKEAAARLAELKG
jgi:DNA-binding transcriptional regulator YiaG